MRAVTLFLCVLLTVSCCVDSEAQLKSPSEFLNYDLGDRFTEHHKVIEYFRHIDDVMPNASIIQYGTTHEERPLILLAFTSPRNFAKLEEIRQNNLRRAGMVSGKHKADDIAIIWLSYNVHGNEASGTEAAMHTVFELLRNDNPEAARWLEKVVVLVDPCVNPDGRERYQDFYTRYGNHPPNSSSIANEHNEPWPGGRTNHYFFDLNRDWAWTVQKESQHRLKVYNQWLPHIHIDFHEQGFNSPYYFAPAAEPIHEVITPWQREFQTQIGKNNARYFDSQGWLYFTKEVFDLFYPSYGDTYPTYSGAIGMTYEQAGGGRGGVAVSTETGSVLRLSDRIQHHHTSAVATISFTASQSSRLVNEFEKYFRDNNLAPASIYKTYILSHRNSKDKLNKLCQWMKLHGIQFGKIGKSIRTTGYDYQTGVNKLVDLMPDDIVISSYQPKSRFITAVFEPTSRLSDSLTYDITAWNIMYAYDLDGVATKDKLLPSAADIVDSTSALKSAKDPYAYIFRYESIEDAALLGRLLQRGVNVRATKRKFSIGGEEFLPGSLVITRKDNEEKIDFLPLISGRPELPFVSTTGLADIGRDLGSGNLKYIDQPKIAVLFGDQTSPSSTGEIWHFLEQELKYPSTQLGSDYFKVDDLNDFDVFIIPEGDYSIFDDSALEKIGSWISRGGRLIVVGNALNSFVDRKGFSLKKYFDDDEKKKFETDDQAEGRRTGSLRLEEDERKKISSTIPGAIYRATLDNSHPLGYGMSSHYFTLKTNARRFAPLSNGWNVSVLGSRAKPIQGFAGFSANKQQENSLVIGVEQRGDGSIIYFVDNPLFRGFWENGKLLFANALFMSGR